MLHAHNYMCNMHNFNSFLVILKIFNDFVELFFSPVTVPPSHYELFLTSYDTPIQPIMEFHKENKERHNHACIVKTGA